MYISIHQTLKEYAMKTKLLAILIFCLGQNAFAQLVVNTSTENPTQLAISVFQSPGVTLSNIKFNGTTASANNISDQIGSFSNGNTTNIGLDSGVIMTTGKAVVAIGPNHTGNASQPTTNPAQGDPDLATLSTNTIFNKASLEFDFVPQGTNLSFDFVFASEEYPEFVNSFFNDVLGFFINGPGLSGPFSNNSKNIALVLPSLTPVAINNLNNGTANNGPCELCEFYVNNGTGTTPQVNSTIQYDGFTTVLSAKATLIPNETYHLKIIVANAGDNSYDSALFLKAFSIGGLGTDNFKKENDVYVSYPQQNIILFQIGKNKLIDQLVIYDMLGKKITEIKNINQDNFEFNLSALSKGIYIVDLKTSEGLKITKKIVVQ